MGREGKYLASEYRDHPKSGTHTCIYSVADHAVFGNNFEEIIPTGIKSWIRHWNPFTEAIKPSEY